MRFLANPYLIGSVTAVVGTVVGGLIYGLMPTTLAARAPADAPRPAREKAVVFAPLTDRGVAGFSVDVERLRIRNGVRPVAGPEALDVREVPGGTWGYASVTDLSARMRRRTAGLKISSAREPDQFEVHVLDRDDPYVVGFVSIDVAKRLSVPLWIGTLRLYNHPSSRGDVVAAFALWAVEPLGASIRPEDWGGRRSYRVEYDVRLARRLP